MMAESAVAERFPKLDESLDSPEVRSELEKPFMARPALIKHEKEPEPTHIADDAGYESVKPGAKFYDPEGQLRTKPYAVTDDASYKTVPEGAQFVDPEGQLRQKPKFEGIDFTSQTLYDMAYTDKERQKALERGYPGKVKQDSEGLYVEDNGKFRRPGRGITKVTGALTGMAAPTAGGVLGALGGGALGNAPGAIIGAAGGSMAGQGVNDIVLQLAGIYDRSLGEEAINLGTAGAFGAAGEGAGRIVAGAVPTIREGISNLSEAAPKALANFLGATKENTRMARELAEKGVMVPPSAWAKESPHVQNLVEVFDPAFRTQKPLEQSATGYYEKSAGQLLRDMGVDVKEGQLLQPETAVATKPAGEALRARALNESQKADEALRAALDARRAQAQAGLPEKMAQRETLLKAESDARQAAQSLIDQGFKDIAKTTDDAFKVANAGANSGDLWQAVGDKMRAIRQGISARAEKMYGEADTLAGGHLPNAAGLSDTADAFLKQMPGEFEQKYPDIVRKLRDLAGVRGEDGEWVKEPVKPTFGQLHNLRSQLRSNVNWYDLTSDIREGTYKFFSRQVDDVLHDKNAVPALKDAAEALDRADKFYADNIKVFNANQIRAIIRGLEAGEPADPANLYKAVVKEGQTDLTAKIRDMVGPNLWAGVRAADTQAMLDSSKNLLGAIDGRAFAREVLDRYRSNMLQVVHGKEASEKLLGQAQAIENLAGRLPLQERAGDTMTQLIARAHAAADAAKEAAKQDPIGTLAKEMKGIERDHAREMSKLGAGRRSDPLGFLYDPTTGAAEAVDKILKNEDLILATAARFGEQSPEFNMLRQVYAQRILQGTLEPGKRLEKISPEVQAMMFPGISANQMQTLAKEMAFLMDTRAARSQGAGSSMSAFAKVEHPITGIKGLRTVAKIIPGANPAARATLSKFYALVTKIMTSPALLRYVEKGLNGSPEQQAAVREILRAHLQRGGAMGAGAVEGAYQTSGSDGQ